ncbi:MAG: transcription antitermination factor NusB, partial [Spirochaetaceae bacterium]|nr:transcription antitermination factor NusB [Spirochaetaceae bacterium]
VAGTIEHIAEIDALIKKHLDSWDFERINKVDLAVLRISVYPLLYQSDDIHPSIIINEAIDISKEYGPGDTYKFVNAVLDNIRKEISR